MSPVAVEIEDEADVRPLFPDMEPEPYNDHQCATCFHERKRHAQGKFECYVTVETRTVLLQGDGSIGGVVKRSCNCQEFV